MATCPRWRNYHAELGNVSATKDAQVQLHQVAGAIAFFKGDDSNAIAEFDLAIAALKAGTRKRKIFVRGFCGVFYLIALIRSGAPDDLAKAKRLAKAGMDDEANPWKNMMEDLGKAVEYVLGEAKQLVDPYGWQEAPPAELLSIGWLELWSSGVETPELRRFDRLMLDAECVESDGYTWLAAELYELASRFGERKDAKPLADKAKALRAQVHPKLRSPFNAIGQRESWEETLLGIELIAQKSKPAKKKSASKHQAEARLVWVIRFEQDRPEYWHITPYEQKLGKSGKWNKPRAIALKRFNEKPPDYLSEQDRRASVHISKEYDWSGKQMYYLKQDRAILQLIGHPLVFRDEALQLPVELAKREAELVLQPAGKDEIYLRLEPEITPGNAVTITQDTPSRLFVTETTKAVRGLQELFGADGITLPEAAKERVLKAAGALAGEIHIQSQIGGENLMQAMAVEADATPQLHLVPHGNGLSAEMFTQPIAEFGNHYQPGHGLEVVFARDADDVNLQAKRSLEAEVTSARTAIDACPTLDRGERASPYHWLLPDPVHCLELLTELHHLDPAALSVHWPKGESFKLKAEVGSQHLRMTLKKDREWFKADGELKVDDDLVLSMQQLLDLIEGDNTGRFVQLSDGQFLALTEEFERPPQRAEGILHGDEERRAADQRARRLRHRRACCQHPAES